MEASGTGAKHSSWFWRDIANDDFLTLQRKCVRLASFSRNWSRIQVTMSDIDFVPTRMMLELSESVIRLEFEFRYISRQLWSPSKFRLKNDKTFMKKLISPISSRIISMMFYHVNAIKKHDFGLNPASGNHENHEKMKNSKIDQENEQISM